MAFTLSVAFTALSLLVSRACASDVFINLPVTNAIIAPDGFNRSVVLAGGTHPGTLITANKGDTLHINVTDSLTDPAMRRSTSIHWHGLFQNRTASEDGPSFVNQCPISPGHFYQYNIPLGEQTGTFWYHSHLSTQYVDGERGVLVIYPNDPQKSLYDIDDASTIITLTDWYHGHAEALMAAFQSNGHEPVPDSGLINGVGRYVGGPAVPWAVVNVQQGKKYRLRVANIAGFAAFTFEIDGHNVDVIEADGIAHQPVTVKRFEIYPAQRYSVVLNANQTVANYWIRAPMTVKGSSATLDPDNVYAILRYAGAPSQDPTTQQGSGDTLEEYALQPLANPGAPGGSAPADRVIDLDFGTGGPGVWMINGIQYTPPSLPTLLKIMNGATVASDFTTSEHTFILDQNSVIELHIHGSADGITHPFHLHGHAFDVVQSASGGPINYVNPPRRDVVAVEGGGVIIRFRADNPGPWFLHWVPAHWHLEAGLAVVFAEAPAAQRQTQIIPPAWQDLCPIYQALPPDQQ